MEIKRIISILLLVCFVVSLTSVAASTSATLPTQQDKNWGNNARGYLDLMSADISAIGLDEQYSSYDNLIIDGKNVVKDSQNALIDNAKYIVSPKYKQSKEEYKAMFQDLNSMERQ